MESVRSMLLLLLAFAGAGLAQPDNNLVYQIFVRSFADSAGDTAPDKREVGDLKGIVASLDYLNDGKPHTDKDLEVGILWLMPVFPSKSYHGYDITDFRSINPDYGSLQDLDALVQAAHQRGVRIILDIAFNHTSNHHDWFRQAVEDPASRFRKFYHFSEANLPGPWHTATSSSGRQIRYLGLFSPSMPDLNLAEAEVRQEVKAAAKFWLDRGIDGFRLDAAKHVFGDTFGSIPEPDILKNNDWWREFSDFVYGINPRAVLVGEVLGGDEAMRRHAFGLDALLDEEFMKAGRARIAFPQSGFVQHWAGLLKRCRDVNLKAHGTLPRTEPFQLFTFLASHDENPRLASHLEELKRQGMQASVEEAYRAGMHALVSFSKYPVLYNGDELMQRGFKWNGNPQNHRDSPGDGSGIYDETLREPFPWRRSGAEPAAKAPQTSWFAPRFDKGTDGISVAEQKSNQAMLSLVRALTNLRTEHPGYANGEMGAVLTDSAEWMVFEKVNGQERYLALMNTTATGKDYAFHQDFFPQYIGAQLIFWSDGQKKRWKNETKGNKRIETKVFVPPHGFVLLRQKPTV